MCYPSVYRSSGVSRGRPLPHDTSEEGSPEETLVQPDGFVKAYYFVKSRLIKGVSKPLFQRCYVNPKTEQIIKVGEPYFWGNNDKEESFGSLLVGLIVCKKCGHTVPDALICVWCGAKLKVEK